MACGHAPAMRSPRGRAVALLAGLLAAIVAAVIWGYIADLTKHEYSIVAVGVGLAVGAAVMWARAGDPGGVALAGGAAVIAIAGCVLGSLTAVILVLHGGGVSLSQIFGHPAALTHA